MRKIVTLTAAAALVLAFGLTGTAKADPNADVVEILVIPTGANVSGDNGDGGADTLGAQDCPPSCNGSNNDTFTSLGFNPSTPAGGVLILKFTDNVCLDLAGDDLTVFEQGAAETYTVDTGLITVGTLTAAAIGAGGLTLDDPHTNVNSTDFEVVGNFNRMRITATDLQGSADFSGADIDAVLCVSTVDKADIVKDFAVNPLDNDDEDEIFVIEKGDFTVQHKAFTIKITNNTGINGGLAGLTFFDAVPAEYDLDPLGEDLADGGGIDSCASGDGNCNGIAEDANGKCTVTATRTQGASRGKHGGNKLEPELLSINAGTLNDAEMCTTTVYVKTEAGHKKSTTPTSCPVDLNSGVKVFDSVMNLLLQDDDQLIFVTTPTKANEGLCNLPVED